MSAQSFSRTVAESIREIIFGLEDSLVSTLGTLTGIAIGTRNAYIVILSGLVVVITEVLSMAAGSYLSSKSASETEQVLHFGNSNGHTERSVRAAGVMAVSYLLGGFVPLAPYLFLSVDLALLVSIPVTAIVLFLVGVWSAKYTKRPFMRSGVEMLVISLSAALVAYLIARGVNWYFGIGV
jgi:predicted membrane protein (TIGR00267 family)